MQSFPGRFEVTTSSRFSVEPVLRVLRGELAAVVFRGYCDAPECVALLERFLADEHVRRRQGDAPGAYLGTFHWGKDEGEYRADAARIRGGLEAVIASPQGAPWRGFMQELDRGLRLHETTLRGARWNGAEALFPLIRAWDGTGEFSLVPHDDLAQCQDPRQASFEIQSVPRYAACSINLCIANDGGGALVLWDCVPTDEDRQRAGTQFTGGPYPPSLVESYRKLEIEVAVGDLWIFNGGLVHAVRRATGRRATVSSLFGLRDEHTVILWT